VQTSWLYLAAITGVGIALAATQLVRRSRRVGKSMK
jgi:hypothetical protein